MKPQVLPPAFLRHLTGQRQPRPLDIIPFPTEHVRLLFELKQDIVDCEADGRSDALARHHFTCFVATCIPAIADKLWHITGSVLTPEVHVTGNDVLPMIGKKHVVAVVEVPAQHLRGVLEREFDEPSPMQMFDYWSYIADHVDASVRRYLHGFTWRIVHSQQRLFLVQYEETEDDE